MPSLIRAQPPTFGRATKSAAKRMLPSSDHTLFRLTSALNTWHQRYLEDFVFIHIPKCGGTSVERALGVPFLNHDTAHERRAKLGEKRWSRRYKFTVVRHPIQRITSLYLFRRRDRPVSDPELAKAFGPFLERIADALRRGRAGPWGPQWHFTIDDDGEFILDDYFKLEEMASSWSLLEARLGRRLKPVRLNQRRRNVREEHLLSPQNVELIEEIFRVDLEKFGYRREQSP